MITIIIIITIILTIIIIIIIITVIIVFDEAPPSGPPWRHPPVVHTANLRNKILDFRGFDSSRVLMLMGGIPMVIGNSPEVICPYMFTSGYI